MSEKRKVTLKDIARELGISVSTASRALNGYEKISAETIKMVKEFAEKHHYTPNLLAVNLRKNRTSNIGIIVPEIVHHFFSTVISGTIDMAKKHGYNVLVSQSDDLLKDEIIACRTLLGSSVDGLLISISNETVEGDHIQEFLDEGKPVIQFDKITDLLDTPKVIVDDFDGAYLAVKHLIDQGYKKIAHIGGRKDVKNSVARLNGYEKALKDNRLESNEDWVLYCQKISEHEGFEFARKLMESKNPPDAIFCITDLVAFGVIKYLKSADFKIPEQVGVMGFSNWQLADIVTPGLSSVDQHGYQMGQKATELMIKLLKNHSLGENEIIELKTNLIVRESSSLASKKV
jgi:LacI family transcriptional regulator